MEDETVSLGEEQIVSQAHARAVMRETNPLPEELPSQPLIV